MKRKIVQQQKINKEEMVSLNNELFSDFSIQELEMRLETDPLAFTNLFSNIDLSESPCGCHRIGSCPTLVCGCDGGANTNQSCQCNGVNIGCSEISV